MCLLPSSKMTKIIKPKEPQEGSSIRKSQTRIHQGKRELVLETVNDLSTHSPLDQLVLASKIDDTIHQLIGRLETNVKMLRRLVIVPRTQEMMEMIDIRSNLGVQIFKLINSHVGLDVTQPIIQTKWEICRGEMKPITLETPKIEKMVEKVKN